MLWNTPQSGYNQTYPGLNAVCLYPGDDYALFDGTEANVATGTKSVHFTRGTQGDTDAGTTFSVTGCPNGSVIEIQGSNGVAQSTSGPTAPIVAQTPTSLDASFNTVGTITGNGPYLDPGRYQYYRAIVSTFEAGDVPVVIAKR